MKREVVIGERAMTLTSMFPAIVSEENGEGRNCRTVFADQDGVLWCKWHGEYRNVRKTDGLKLPKGKRARESYVVVDG